MTSLPEVQEGESRPERNDDPEHIAAVAAMAEKRGCDWPGYPCGRGIPEFAGRDAECACETIVNSTRRMGRWELFRGRAGFRVRRWVARFDATVYEILYRDRPRRRR